MLLDDELPGLSYLKMLCDQFEELEVVKAFNHPEIFLREVATIDFDLCIIDIEMPGMNGLQVASLLNGKPVIFTTAYKDYAAEAFDLNAIDYVRKPVQRERLRQAVQKAVQRHSYAPPSKEFVQLNTDRGKSLIYFSQLLYCSVSPTDSRDKIAYLTDGSQLTLKNISFEKLMDALPSDQFCRINKKDLIRIRAVQSFSHEEVSIKVVAAPGQPLKLPLSDTYRKEFIQRVNH